MTPKKAEYLLQTLCVELGYCLSFEEQQRICNCPPGDVRSFVDAVLMAEGLTPALVSREQRQALTQLAEKAFANR